MFWAENAGFSWSLSLGPLLLHKSRLTPKLNHAMQFSKKWTLSTLVYLEGGPWVLTPWPCPCTEDSSVKVDSFFYRCLPYSWGCMDHGCSHSWPHQDIGPWLRASPVITPFTIPLCSLLNPPHPLFPLSFPYNPHYSSPSPKINVKVGAAAVINRHFQNGETACRQLSKGLPDNSTIFAAEATAISLALNYYQHMDPVHHDVVVYSDSMSCLQAIEGEDTENPFICHIMNLLWSLSDKGTSVRFCWVPSHCGIEGNERVDQLAKETLGQDIDPLASFHFTDMKSLVNYYIQKLVQTKWDVSVHGRDLYFFKPTLGPPKKFQHLTRAEEVAITRLRIGHTKATKSHILSRGLPTGCHHCGQTLTIDHILLQCALLQECRDEYYTVDSLNALFETIPETCIVEFLREAGFFYLIWCNLLTSTIPQTWTIWSDLSNCLENESNSETHLPV